MSFESLTTIFNPAPIVLFVYNRVWHTKQTVEALQKNELAAQSDLFIYSDSSKNDLVVPLVQDVRDYIKTIVGFKSVNIILRDNNWGLSNNIIDGVTQIVSQYNKVIVIEDDLVTSPFFLRYMNDALTAYEFNKAVGCISGYIYPINDLDSDFFIKGADCWGWATWSRAWEVFEENGSYLLKIVEDSKLANDPFNLTCGYTKMLQDQIVGKNNSWAIRWYFSCLVNNLYCLYPSISFVQNIGFDDSGTHCGFSDEFNVKLTSNYDFKKVDIVESLEGKKKIMNFFLKSNSIIRRIYHKIRVYFISLVRLLFIVLINL